MTKYDARPGAGDPETGLRASLAVCVADVRMPTGLLDRAAARNRKRAARARLIGAASTAAVLAAAAVIVSVPGQPAARKAPAPHAAAPRAQTAAPRAQTAAYVLRRAAAAEANSYRLISVS